MIKSKRVYNIISIAGFILAWYFLVHISNTAIFPNPTDTLKALLELIREGVLFSDIFISLQRVFIGFIVALLLGVVLGFLVGSHDYLKKIFVPILEFLRPIPPIAWIPISITLFGISDYSAYFIIFIGAFYPIYSNTVLGILEIPEIYKNVAKNLRVPFWQYNFTILLEGALPSIIAGAKIGLGFAWMCVIAAEMVSARSGIGYQIQLNRQLLQLDRVVADMVVIGIIGFLMNRLMVILEYWVLPYKRDNICSSGTVQENLVGNNDFFNTLESSTGAELNIKDIS